MEHLQKDKREIIMINLKTKQLSDSIFFHESFKISRLIYACKIYTEPLMIMIMIMIMIIIMIIIIVKSKHCVIRKQHILLLFTMQLVTKIS